MSGYVRCSATSVPADLAGCPMARAGGVAENTERAVKKFVRVVGGVVTQAGHPRVDSLDRVSTWGSGQDESLLDRGELSADLLGIETKSPNRPGSRSVASGPGA